MTITISRKTFALKILSAAFFVIGLSASAQEFYLHDGDRVTFYGDSITAQRLYTQDIEAWVDTRYPAMHVEFHNAGVPGDRVTGGYAGDAQTRVTRDVAPFDPTVLTVMLGMNEGGYTHFQPAVIPPFQSGYANLIKLLQAAAPKARMTLLENTSYDEITHGTEYGGYMDTTQRLARSTTDVAAKANLPLIDLETPFEELLRAAAKTEPKLAPLLVPDRIHPAEAGHWVMALTVMKAWHVAPMVSSVDLDAATATVKLVRQANVSGLSGNSTGLAWDQQEALLPLPLNINDPAMQMVLRLTDLASYDQEMLRVHGLAPGSYKIIMDKWKMIGPFSAEQLDQGINLAVLDTPMLLQARQLSSILENRSKLEQAEFYLRAETTASGKEAASKALAEGEAEYTKKARVKLATQAHRFALSTAASGW